MKVALYNPFESLKEKALETLKSALEAAGHEVKLFISTQMCGDLVARFVNEYEGQGEYPGVVIFFGANIREEKGMDLIDTLYWLLQSNGQIWSLTDDTFEELYAEADASASSILKYSDLILMNDFATAEVLIALLSAKAQKPLTDVVPLKGKKRRASA